MSCALNTCLKNIKSLGLYSLLYALIFKYIMAEFYDLIRVFNDTS